MRGPKSKRSSDGYIMLCEKRCFLSYSCLSSLLLRVKLSKAEMLSQVCLPVLLAPGMGGRGAEGHSGLSALQRRLFCFLLFLRVLFAFLGIQVSGLECRKVPVYGRDRSQSPDGTMKILVYGRERTSPRLRTGLVTDPCLRTGQIASNLY